MKDRVKVLSMLKLAGLDVFTLIYQDQNEVVVLNEGSTQDLLSVLREGIGKDDLCCSACADLVQERILPPKPSSPKYDPCPPKAITFGDIEG